MTRTALRILVAACAALALALMSSTPVGAQLAELELEIEPVSAEVLLGESIDIAIRVTNRTDAPTAPLVVHIDVTDPTQASSVDPEDWTATLSRGIGTVDAGQAKVVRWNIQPIAGGQFALYAVALTPGGSDIASSNVLTIDVTEQRTLNPEGILPVSIGLPVLVGGVWLVQARMARRRDRIEV